MATTQVRASAEWLRLREPADAHARAGDLVAHLLPHLVTRLPLVIHDVGCGSGSMARWLARQLPGPQHWVLHDRDSELLDLAAAMSPVDGSGVPVTLETRLGDVTRLDPDELAGASLVTASALLDMMTAPELERLVATCTQAQCPVLIALSVTGRVDLTPAEPFDRRVAEAFNAHQRRVLGGGRLLGPDAVGAAVEGFSRRGLDAVVSPSPWRLGSEHAALITEWLAGWVGAACEQCPELGAEAAAYTPRRLEEAAAGLLSVTVHHEDLLVLPR